jgi:hypothetical protein
MYYSRALNRAFLGMGGSLGPFQLSCDGDQNFIPPPRLPQTAKVLPSLHCFTNLRHACVTCACTIWLRNSPISGVPNKQCFNALDQCYTANSF